MREKKTETLMLLLFKNKFVNCIDSQESYEMIIKMKKTLY